MTDTELDLLVERLSAMHGRTEVAVLSEAADALVALMDKNALVVEGQQSLMAQTVRIRDALGGTTREGTGTLTGDTEDIAKALRAERDGLRGLASHLHGNLYNAALSLGQTEAQFEASLSHTMFKQLIPAQLSTNGGK